MSLNCVDNNPSHSCRIDAYRHYYLHRPELVTRYNEGMADLSEERYVCQKCLQMKEIREAGFGLVWHRRGREVYICKKCANKFMDEIEKENP